MKKSALHTVELLAPAKDAQTAIDAINYGADAVYMGPQRFGARASAGNSVDDMRIVADYAHKFNAKLYATVNTILYDSELKEAERLITDLYRVGVDAIIVQDMSILRLDLPPIALHSSTQCDLRTLEKARFLSSLGFSQLVMARELSFEEIKAIHNATQAKLEAFIYGALCVSYSGRCQVSEALFGRSANRGECAQVCRMAFDLVDEKDCILQQNKHLLSLKDLNQTDNLLGLIESGVSSFKIEGRLKDANYVKNSVAHFRQRIDEIIANNSTLYARSSKGVSTYDFEPSPEKCFNRSYTHYFLTDRQPKNGQSMASLITPKSLGEPIGTVISNRNNQVKINTKSTINNGDGLSYFNGNEFTGFRANKVEGGIVYANSKQTIQPGTLIYRTHDKMHSDALEKSQTTRKIRINSTLRSVLNTLVLDVTDERGNSVTATMELESLSAAQKDQRMRQIETLSKLGNTIYQMEDCVIDTNVFVPASALTQLRREATDLLDSVQLITYQPELRLKENLNSVCDKELLYSADNVANEIALKLYEDHGAKIVEKAIEVKKNNSKEQLVMHTRYCIRRELNACKKSDNAKALPDNIFLRTGKNKLRVECDCKNCEMKLYLVK